MIKLRGLEGFLHYQCKDHVELYLLTTFDENLVRIDQEVVAVYFLIKSSNTLWLFHEFVIKTMVEWAVLNQLL